MTRWRVSWANSNDFGSLSPRRCPEECTENHPQRCAYLPTVQKGRNEEKRSNISHAASRCEKYSQEYNAGFNCKKVNSNSVYKYDVTMRRYLVDLTYTRDHVIVHFFPCSITSSCVIETFMFGEATSSRMLRSGSRFDADPLISARPSIFPQG